MRPQGIPQDPRLEATGFDRRPAHGQFRLSALSFPPWMSPLVVFSHLRWDFVYQRPQHILSRLAATRPVVVIEEPIHDAAVEAGAAPFAERQARPTA